jgi:TolB-like protein
VTQASPATPPVVPDYELLRRIGQGSYGDVWLARGITGIYRAVKVVWRDRFENAEPFEREFRGLRDFASFSLKAEGQMALLHIGRNAAAGFFYYVMELADDASQRQTFDPATYVPLTLKEWRQRKGRLPAQEVIAAGAELATALAALHAAGLVHRDIKPSNAILVNGKAKLADIGLVAAAYEARTFIGTMGYVPPEGPGSPAADVYALGRVLYELATGLDRDDFPKLPSGLDRAPDRKELFALNEVLLRACAPADAGRYHDARGLAADLVALRSGRSLPPAWGRRWPAWTVVAALVLAAGSAAWNWWPRGGAASVAPKQIAPAEPGLEMDAKAIAVLPFTTPGEDRENGFLADGIQEDVVTNLAGIRALRVVSLNSAQRYRGTTKSVHQIGLELRAAYLVSGSVRREGNHVRVTAQLVDARTDQQVWAHKFDREVSDKLALQSDLADQIVPALQVALSPEEKTALNRAPTANDSAYDLFLRARSAHQSFANDDPAPLKVAEPLLRQALAMDPSFVRAWAELAAVHIDRYQSDESESNPARAAMAQEAIDAARRLSPDDPEVLLVQGRLRYMCYHDNAGAMYYYQKILDAYPNYPDIHFPLSHLYRRLGRWGEAIKELRLAHAQDPGSRRITSALLWNLRWAHAYAESDIIQRQDLALFPDDQETKETLAFAAFRSRGSRKEWEQWLAELPANLRGSNLEKEAKVSWGIQTGDEKFLLECIESYGINLDDMDAAYGLILAGRRAEAIARLDKLRPEIDAQISANPLQSSNWMVLAKFQALRGERSEALAAIERARQLLPEGTDAINEAGLGKATVEVLTWLGEKDEAIALAEKLIKKPGFIHAWNLRSSIQFKTLRDDPRIQALLNDPKNIEPLF